MPEGLGDRYVMSTGSRAEVEGDAGAPEHPARTRRHDLPVRARRDPQRSPRLEVRNVCGHSDDELRGLDAARPGQGDGSAGVSSPFAGSSAFG